MAKNNPTIINIVQHGKREESTNIKDSKGKEIHIGDTVEIIKIKVVGNIYDLSTLQ